MNSSLPIAISQPSLCREVSLPQYGKQDLGFAPAGAMDQFSFQCGNYLLEQSADCMALEIILAKTITFNEDCLVCLTGAHYESLTLHSEQSNQHVFANTIFKALKNDSLHFGKRTKGFRSYLCLRKDLSAKRLIGKKRKDFNTLTQWPDKENKIRILKGPEYEILINSEQFLNTSWKISHDSNTMGFRLESDQILNLHPLNMISQAVCDGTIQCTPKGPVILMRDRQTVGGYPRIFNVITADLDLLAQYAPNQHLHFKCIEHERAAELFLQKEADLTSLKIRT